MFSIGFFHTMDEASRWGPIISPGILVKAKESCGVSETEYILGSIWIGRESLLPHQDFSPADRLRETAAGIIQ
jgi:hypothetical protein